jgi:putative oxidoreductase
MKYLLLIGRVLFAQIFILSSFSHFKSETISGLASKVPYAEILVPLSGALALLGGISIILGYKAKIGGLLIALFLIPVTFIMHDFWNATPQMAMMQQINFEKNLSMLGGAIFLMYFGAGPLSLDARNRFPKVKMQTQTPEKSRVPEKKPEELKSYEDMKMHEETHI